MAIGYYLPSYDKEREAWFRNFVSKFNEYAPELCFTPFEIAAIRNDCAMFAYLADTVSVLKGKAHKRVAGKILATSEGAEVQNINVLSSSPMPAAVPAGVFRRLSMTVRRIKNHPAYTEVMGAALGILGGESKQDQ
jgi:hypothetical protein